MAADLKFAKTHEWIRPESGGLATVGISAYAVSDFYAPVSGEIVEVNAALPNALETLGQDPYGAGWIVRIRPENPAEMSGLLDQAAYDAQVKAGGH